jgi:hypothetical protein
MAWGSDDHGGADQRSGYWNTSSSGTLKTRAIWKAISSVGEFVPCSMALKDWR